MGALMGLEILRSSYFAQFGIINNKVEDVGNINEVIEINSWWKKIYASLLAGKQVSTIQYGKMTCSKD